jgi:lipopolysaccharide biosynthesis protein
MKSICFFSSYFVGNNIPYYIKCYLNELRRHFEETILLTNEKNLDTQDKVFLSQNNIQLILVENEGFDFGMWYKAFNQFSVLTYDRIGLVNDSCILFKKLDEVFDVIDKSNWDYAGILDTVQIAYHLQSYFIIINKPAIPIVADYFHKNGIINDFEKTIRTYEVGISQLLIRQNLKVGTVYSHTINSTQLNPSFTSISELLAAGFPMIKKKIIFGNYRKGEPLHLRAIQFNFNAEYYIGLIKKYNKELIVDFNLLRSDYNYFKTHIKMIRLRISTIIYIFLRNNYRKLRKLIPIWRRR